jgi:hypothetical protein
MPAIFARVIEAAAITLACKLVELAVDTARDRAVA